MSINLKVPSARCNRHATLPALLLAVGLSGCSLSPFTTTPSNVGIDVAKAALAGGSPQVALQVSQSILNRSPDDVPALLVRGDALTQLHQNEDAVAAFERALGKDPTSVDGRLGLARLRLTTDPTAAATLFRDVLRAEPNNFTAQTDLGIALDLLGQHKLAQAHYQRVVHEYPDNVAVRVNLALSLAMSGDTATALGLIEPLARDQNASIKIKHNYAAILAMAGRRAEATKVLRADLSAEDTTRALMAYRQGTTVITAAPVALNAPPPAPAPPAPPPVRVAKVQPVARPAARAILAAAAALPAPVAAPAADPTVTTETVEMTQISAPATAVPAAVVETSVTPAIRPPLPVPAAATITTESAPLASVPTATAPTPTRPAVTTATAQTGPHVQLGAFNSESAARSEWARLQEKAPDVLAGRAPAFTTVEHNGMTLWRLRTWGFPDQASARGFCSQMRHTTLLCLAYST